MANLKTRLAQLEATRPGAIGKPLNEWTTRELEDYVADEFGYGGPRPIPSSVLRKMIANETAGGAE